MAVVTIEGVAKLWYHVLGRKEQAAINNPVVTSSVLKSDCTLRFKVDAVDVENEHAVSTEKQIPIQILSGALAYRQKSILLVVARGSLLRPTFEAVDFRDGETGRPVKRMTLSRPAEKQLVARNAASERLERSRKAYDDRDTVVAPHKALRAPPASVASATPREELTLAEKVQKLAGSIQPPLNSADAPRADSLSRLLTQALTSADDQMLEACLEVTEPIVIQNTIKRISSSHAMPLLEALIARFERDPRRGTSLMPWIRGTLIIHTAHLMMVLLKSVTIV